VPDHRVRATAVLAASAAAFAALALTVTPLARLIVLGLVARPRPVDQPAPAASWSFPSGHTTASATAALVVVMVCWPLLRARWSRFVLAAVAGGWAVIVGVSRVALVVHWPSDVLGGWLFALTMVLGIRWVTDRVFRTRMPGDSGSPVATT
jgi:undecaprenyl-diphosphatase